MNEVEVLDEPGIPLYYTFLLRTTRTLTVEDNLFEHPQSRP